MELLRGPEHQFTHHWNLTSNACHVTSPKVVPKSTGCVAESTIGLAQGAERGGMAHKGTLEVVRGDVAHKGLAQEAEKKGSLVQCRDIVVMHSHSCRNPQEDKCPRPEEGCPRPEEGCPRPEKGCPRPEEGCPRLEQGCPRPEQGFPRLGPGGHAQEAVMDGTDHLGLIRKSDTIITVTVTRVSLPCKDTSSTRLITIGSSWVGAVTVMCVYIRCVQSSL